jgi:hypothetical protein
LPDSSALVSGPADTSSLWPWAVFSFASLIAWHRLARSRGREKGLSDRVR